MTPVTAPKLQPLSTEEDALLRALGRVMNVLPRAVDADMVREQHIPLVEYLTLMHLSETPHRMMRMSELAATCDLSLSGMTRLVARLEDQGLVERVQCNEDGRGWNAVLTDDGLARLERAWPTHLASVRRHLFDQIQASDIKRITRALQHVAAQ